MSTAEVRLRALLAANRTISRELSLAAVLRRIVDVARDVARAEYAALGVFDRDRRIQQFIHAGMPPQTVARLPHPPHGQGLLGALIDHPEPIRVRNVAADGRSVGFPAGHPPMGAFLGVPIRSHNETFGNLYLTNPMDSEEFSDEDLELIQALAASASIAIETARLYEDSRRSQEWLRASQQISQELLGEPQDEQVVLRRIATSVHRLADADLVLILLAEQPGQLRVAVALGLDTEEWEGTVHATGQTLAGRAMAQRGGLLAPNVVAEVAGEIPQTIVSIEQALAVPLTGQQVAYGAIVVGRRQAFPRLRPDDIAMAETFAGQAAAALELARARTDRQRLDTLEDRDRIARDLHDHVIQRLFATGLSIQGVAATVDDDRVRNRLIRAVGDVDETIRQIRTSIFALREPEQLPQSLRSIASSVVRQLREGSEIRVALVFAGPIDSVADQGLTDDVEAVLWESLTNVKRHAAAGQVSVTVSARNGAITITVLDDGVGLPAEGRRSGLANLQVRAERRGGTLRLTPGEEGGTRLQWSIPLPH